MEGMQEEFTQGVRELLKATRPHVNYVKDFERRAEDDPKGCAEEAQREIMGGAATLQRAFKEAFDIDFERAFEETFYLTPDQQHAIRETAPLPDHPTAREFFLLWLYWLHFHKITLGYFLRHLQAAQGPHSYPRNPFCRASTGRHEAARSPAYLGYPYLSGCGRRRSRGILARLEIDARKSRSPEGYPGPVVFDDVWLTDSREELTETATRLLFGIGAVVDGLTPSSGPSYA